MKTFLFPIFAFAVSVSFATADVVIDDFNTNRTYAPCCGEYGTYDSFTNSITQSGGGTLVIGGSATDNGGFYREGFGNALWNFAGPTNLVLSLRPLPGNVATNLSVLFRDVFGASALFQFSLAGLTTNALTNLAKTLHAPDWTNDHAVAYSYISSLDVYGGYSENGDALRVELNSLTAVGPVLEFGPPITLYRDNPNIVLTWQTNYAADFILQSATNLAGPWTNEAAASVTGSVYQVAYPATNGTKFFRLVNPNGSSLTDSDGKDGVEWLAGGMNNPMSHGNWSIPTPLFRTKAFGPPPVVTYFSNFIDVASYSGWSSNAYFHEIAGDEPVDYQAAYALDFSDHSGGVASYNMFDCDLHTGTSGNPWIRLSNHVFTFQDTFSPSSNNWPGGFRTQSGETQWTGSAGTNQPVGKPYIPYANISGMSRLWTGGNTNIGGGSSGYRATSFRRDETHLDLHTGRVETNQISKWVLLSVTASSVEPHNHHGMVLYLFPADSGCACAWPEGSSLGRVTETSIPFSNITCLANIPNADSKIFLPFSQGATYDATPSVSPSTNHFFSVSINPHNVVSMTRAYHPLFDLAPSTPPDLTTLRLKYHVGSLRLGRDDDSKIPDNHASVAFNNNETSLYRNDDAPAYVEFRIAEGPMTTNVYTRRFQSVFTPPWDDKKYFDIVTKTAAISLVGNAQANIKQVNSMAYDGKTFFGGTAPGIRSTILTSTANPVTVIHEFGHSCGLDHRDATDDVGQLLNPGNGGNAVMDPVNDLTNVKINRHERNVINNATQ